MKIVYESSVPLNPIQIRLVIYTDINQNVTPSINHPELKLNLGTGLVT